MQLRTTHVAELNARISIVKQEMNNIPITTSTPPYQTIPYQGISLPTVESIDLKPSKVVSQRDLVKKYLLEAGMLVTDIEVPEMDDVNCLNDNMLPIKLPPNTPTWAELLEEERGPY